MESEQSFKVQQKQVIDYLQEGKSYLEQNAPDQALSVLKKALDLVPSNVAVRTLLALSHFKLGHFSEAEEMYKALIEEKPNDASLRVHLAMQYLQRERFEEARELLEAAEQLAPSDETIHSSLAIIYGKLEDYERAKEKYLRIGREDMAQKMELKLQETRTPSNVLELDLPTEEPPSSQMTTMEEAPSPSAITDETEAYSEENKGEEEVVSVVVLPVPDPPSKNNSEEEEDVPFSLEPRDPLHSGELDAAEPFIPKHSSASLPSIPAASLAPKVDQPKLWLPFDNELQQATAPFSLLEEGHLLIHSEQSVYARLGSLLYLSGTPNIIIQKKRFRGKFVDQIFGPSDNPIVCLEGESQLFLRADNSTFRTILDINLNQAAYFREGIVLAFEETLSWENGRISSPESDIPDLPLDNLWGDGRVVLEGKKRFWGVPVKAGKRVRVAYDHLIGWLGTLMPRIVVDKEIPTPDGHPRAFVEFEGEGGVITSS